MRQTTILMFAALLCGLQLRASTTITVRTVAELLRAIGDDQTILVGKGIYDFSTADTTSGSHHRWEIGFGKQELHIIDVHNLTIRPCKGAKAIFSTSSQFGQVMVFENCSNLRLERLRFTRDLQEVSGEGGALRFTGCKRVLLQALDLQTHRDHALVASDCDHLRCEHLRILGCSGRAIVLADCNLAVLVDCSLAANSGSALVYARDCNSLQLHRCNFLNNVLKTPDAHSILIDVGDCNEVLVYAGMVKGNEADHLSNSSLAVQFVKTQFLDGNRWRRAKFQQIDE
jgi:hypothetical protein